MASRRALLAGLGAALSGLATGPAAAAPVVVTDALGRQVAIPAPPRRIVPIFASNTELVAAAGLAGRIVGIEAYTRFPPEVAGLPQVGGRLGFSVERVARLRPDLVFVTPARQAVHLLVDPMERLGIPIIVLTHPTVAAVLHNLRLVARAGGVGDHGEQVAAALQARLDAIAAAGQTGSGRPRAVMVTGRVSNGLFLVARPGSYTADAMVAAGLSLAFDRPGMLAQVAPEAIFRIDPDLILFAGTPQGLQETFGRPEWTGLRARREGRLFVVNRAEFLIPGPRVVDGIEKLATVIRLPVPATGAPRS